MSDPLLKYVAGGDPQPSEADPLLGYVQDQDQDPLLRYVSDPVFGAAPVANRVEKSAEIANSATPYLDKDFIRERVAEQRERFPDTSYEAKREAGKANRAITDLKSAVKLEPTVRSMAERSGDPELQATVEKKLKPEGGFWRNWRRLSGLERLGHAVDVGLGDVSARTLADPTIPISDFNLSQQLQLEQAPTGAQLMDRWSEARTIEKGDPTQTALLAGSVAYPPLAMGAVVAAARDPYGVMEDVSSVADTALGYGIGVPYELVRAQLRAGKLGLEEAKRALGMGPGLSDVMTGNVEERDSPSKIWGDLVQDIQKPAAVKGLGAEMLLSPTNLLTFGTKGAAVQATKQTKRALRGMGLDPNLLSTIADEVGAAVAKHGGDVGLKEALDGIVSKYQLPVDAIERVFGKNFDWAGRSGASVAGIDVTDAADRALSAVSGGKVRAPEQLLRRGVEAVSEPLMSKTMRDVGWHARQGIKTRASVARNLAKAGAEDKLTEARDALASVMPEDPKRAEELILNHMDPARGAAASPASLSPSEQQFIQEWDRLFTKWGTELEQVGVIDGLARNPETGVYVPRSYSPDDLRGLFDRLFGVRGFTPAREGSSAASRVVRGPAGLREGVPLGENAARVKGERLKAVHHPAEIVTRYVPKMERKIQVAKFREWAGDAFGIDPSQVPQSALQRKNAFEVVQTASGEKYVPREVMSAIDKEFDRAFNSMISNALDRMMRTFKTVNTLPVPRYHITNMTGDALMMWAGGFTDARWMGKARDVLEKAPPAKVLVQSPYRRYTAGEVRDLLRQYGIDGGQIGQAQVDMMHGSGRIKAGFQKQARAGAQARGEPVAPLATHLARQAGTQPGELARTVVTQGRNKAGETVAREWDRTSKAAFFMHRLSRGDSPNIAAKRTFEVLYDYGDQDKFLRWVRKFVPFATWAYKSMGNVPKAIVRRPALIPTPERIARAAGAQEGDYRDEPPRVMSEMRRTIPLPAAGREAISSASEGAGAGPLHPGYGVSLGLRFDPAGEALAPWLEALGGNLDPLFLMGGPHVQYLRELSSQQDILTKQPLDPGAPWDVLPYSVGPTWLQADSPQETSMMRYLPQTALPPDVLLALNAAMGEDALGAHRQRTPLTEQRNVLRLFNMLLGAPMHTTSPADALMNSADSEAVQHAIQARLDAKRAAEQQSEILNR